MGRNFRLTALGEPEMSDNGTPTHIGGQRARCHTPHSLGGRYLVADDSQHDDEAGDPGRAARRARDAELVLALRAGDQSAFATLFDETDPLVGPKGHFTIPEQPLRRSVEVATFSGRHLLRPN